jgi:hypothetical protein
MLLNIIHPSLLKSLLVSNPEFWLQLSFTWLISWVPSTSNPYNSVSSNTYFTFTSVAGAGDCSGSVWIVPLRCPASTASTPPPLRVEPAERVSGAGGRVTRRAPRRRSPAPWATWCRTWGSCRGQVAELLESVLPRRRGCRDRRWHPCRPKLHRGPPAPPPRAPGAVPCAGAAAAAATTTRRSPHFTAGAPSS